jgi:hypothetical protein
LAKDEFWLVDFFHSKLIEISIQSHVGETRSWLQTTKSAAEWSEHPVK